MAHSLCLRGSIDPGQMRARDHRARPPPSVAIVHGVLDPLWSAATRHPFLDAVREGTISDAAFDRWLAQDVLFVADLLVFQARLLARAPRQAQTVLAGGCVALVAELDWFEAMAARRGIDLGPQALPATLAYRELLQRLDAAPFDAAVTALWALERVYLLGWASAASSTSPFGEFIDHWTDPGFTSYVDGLGELATLDGQDDLVADVLTHEVAFWDMALA
ncbi:MAG: formylaminopyrimidine deformylase / aminopyrimidine aminohydrolase [Mycobacterium sp.]|nr:formylaminopyrimidine deformylase / aminopyrimidine aminohydrolase [Mycobacterium sp.]